MNLIDLAERGRIPDTLLRFGMRRMCAQRKRQESGNDAVEQYERFKSMLAQMRTGPIAIHTDKANEQHYEVPAAFFEQVLGPHCKYSSCYWPSGTDNLQAAEAAMLALSCKRAQLVDGQDVLELGCGWGALTLWMAEHYPNSRITALSNSSLQRQFIEKRAKTRGISNVHVITADINDFDIEDRFDRIVSLEMFEHMRNYEQLMAHVAGWLKPEGKLFVHIFCHRELMYPFEAKGQRDWMSQYFFTGGLMPAADTLLYFQEQLRLEEQWRVSGEHYQRSAESWLVNMRDREESIMAVLRGTYGSDEAHRWYQRWRIFFMACAELFGYDHGNEWIVGHYRFYKPAE